MPCYDVECSACGLAATVTLKLAELDAWDAGTPCPSCREAGGAYRRVIRQAPMTRLGGEGSPRSELARKASAKSAFRRSGERADMIAKNEQRADKDVRAAAIEGAAKGD